MDIKVPSVVPTFMAQSGLTVFVPMSSPEFSIQVIYITLRTI
jgi:hypothetical protein